MNKKEFDTIAEVIRGRRINAQHLGVFGWSQSEVEAGAAVLEDLQVFMATKLQTTYPKTFDAKKFHDACEVEQ